MDILKARQRAKQRAAQQQERQQEQQEQQEQQPEQPAASTSLPTPSATTSVPTTIPAAATTSLPAAGVALPASSTLPPTTVPTPSSALFDDGAQRSPRVLDPLAEFLASYDAGAVDLEADELDAELPTAVDEKRFLSFDLAGESYAASIMDIKEILRVVALTEVPRAPREVLGVLSKRGVVMPVLDLAALLGLRAPERAVHGDGRVLVVGEGDRVCGLRVDRVRQVVRIPLRSIEEVPASLGNKNSHMLLGLGRARGERSVVVDSQPTASRGTARPTGSSAAIAPTSPPPQATPPGAAEAEMLILLDVPAVLAHFAMAMGIAPAEAQ